MNLLGRCAAVAISTDCCTAGAGAQQWRRAAGERGQCHGVSVRMKAKHRLVLATNVSDIVAFSFRC